MPNPVLHTIWLLHTLVGEQICIQPSTVQCENMEYRYYDIS